MAGALVGVEPTQLAHKASSKARWLLVASAKGGTGKTTTVLNLAAFAVNERLRVALVDLDTQETLAIWHGLRPADMPAMHLVKAPLRHVERAIADIETAEAANGGFDLVILDTPPGVDQWPSQMKLLLMRCDYVLVPTMLGYGDLRSVAEWMQFLRREKANAAFLLNATNRQTKSFVSVRNALIKAGQICPIDIRRLEDIQTATGTGCGVCEIKGAKGIEDLQGLWDHVRHALEI